MVDVDRVIRVLEDIESSLRIIKEIVSVSLEDFMGDLRSRYALRYALIEVVEAASTIGLHILREDFGVNRVESYAQVYDKLVENRVISRRVGEEMKRLVRLRNLIVHRYWEVDDERLYREARGDGVSVVKKFVEEVRGYVARARDG